MSLWFHAGAAGNLIKRRRGPVMRMVLVAFIGTLWCVAGGVWTLSTLRDIQTETSQVQVDVFLNSETSDRQARAIARGVAAQPSVLRARLVHEEDVWNEFAGLVEVDDDLRTVVTMPRLVRFSPQQRNVSFKAINLTVGGIEAAYRDHIDEVVWPQAYVQMLDARRRDLILLGGASGILSLVMFLLALVYAFRAEIHVAGGDLRVGALLGATTGWIAMPHLIVSALAGATGLVIAFGAIAGTAEFVVARLPWLAAVRIEELGYMAALLAFLGFVVCWWQSRRAVSVAIRLHT